MNNQPNNPYNQAKLYILRMHNTENANIISKSDDADKCAKLETILFFLQM